MVDTLVSIVMATLLLITGLYAGKLEYFVGPLNLVYPGEASPRPEKPRRSYAGNKNTRGAYIATPHGVRTLFGKIQSLAFFFRVLVGCPTSTPKKTKEPILYINESLGDFSVAHFFVYLPLSCSPLGGIYLPLIYRTVITDEGYTSLSPELQGVGVPEVGKLNMENEQSAGNLGHSDSLAASEPAPCPRIGGMGIELSKLIATYPGNTGWASPPICINSYISDHMSKHVRPETDEEFGYYLAGLIEGDG